MSGGWLAREAKGTEDWSKTTCREINMQLRGEMAQVPPMLRGVVEEYTPTREGGKLMGNTGRKVGIATAPEGGRKRVVPLSHWTLRMVHPNYVDTSSKWERVKVSYLWCSGKVHM
jgi:hypothetical protein